MKAQCTHCQAEYDFPGLEALDHPVRVKCERCDQTFEVGAAPPQEPMRLDDLLEGLDDAMKEFSLDVPLQPVPEDIGRAIEEMAPAAEGKVELVDVTVESEEVEVERFGIGAAVPGRAHVEPAGFGGAQEFDMGSDVAPQQASAVEPAVFEVPSEVPAAPKVEVPSRAPEPLPPAAAPPPPAAAPPPPSPTAAPPLPAAAPAPPPSAQLEKAPPPPPKPEPEAAPPPKTEPRRKKMPEEEEKLPPDNIEDLLAEEEAPPEAAPPPPPPVPKKAKLDKKPVKKKQGFTMPQLSPMLLIIAGVGLLVIIGIAVVLAFVVFSEGSASEQWAEAQKKQTIDPVAVAKVFLQACKEPDEAILPNVYYGKTGPAVAKATVESAGQELDQRTLGRINQDVIEKEKLLGEKRAETASKQEVLSRYQALQKTGDPDDIMIDLTSKRRELNAVLEEKSSQIKGTGADLGRLEYDIQQLNQKIAKAQAIVNKYANPKTNLERAQKETNIHNIEMYKEDLANKTREYNENKADVDKRVAEIEALYGGQISGLKKTIEEKMQGLLLLESLKSDNPKPLLDLQAEVKALTETVTALDKEVKALKAEAAQAQKSLARASGGREMLSTGIVSRSSMEVTAVVKLQDDTEKSRVLLTRYVVEKDGQKVVGDWLVEGLK